MYVLARFRALTRSLNHKHRQTFTHICFRRGLVLFQTPSSWSDGFATHVAVWVVFLFNCQELSDQLELSAKAECLLAADGDEDPMQPSNKGAASAAYKGASESCPVGIVQHDESDEEEAEEEAKDKEPSLVDCDHEAEGDGDGRSHSGLDPTGNGMVTRKPNAAQEREAICGLLKELLYLECDHVHNGVGFGGRREICTLEYYRAAMAPSYAASSERCAENLRSACLASGGGGGGSRASVRKGPCESGRKTESYNANASSSGNLSPESVSDFQARFGGSWALMELPLPLQPEGK
jgi:hypothetical protein